MCVTDRKNFPELHEDLVDLEWESFIYLIKNFGFISLIFLFLGQVIRCFIPQVCILILKFYNSNK